MEKRKGKKRLLTLMMLSLCLCLISSCGQTPAPAPDEGDGYTLDNIRNYVVGIDEEMELDNGSKKAVTNFDNAATTPALQPVADEVNEKLQKYGSIGRG